VVRPGRVAHPNGFRTGIFRQEICGYAQCAGTARGLCGASTFVANNAAAFAKQEFLRATAKFRNTVDAEVVFGVFIFQQILLSLFNAGQYRGFAGFIFIDTNAEVNFASS
jgi:hypothetical protein